MIDVKIQKTPLDLDSCVKKAANPASGGTVVFIGTARNKTDERTVLRLDFEAYKDMALNEMKKIAVEASKRWPIHSLLIHHRDGRVAAGETAVIIIVTPLGVTRPFGLAAMPSIH